MLESDRLMKRLAARRTAPYGLLGIVAVCLVTLGCRTSQAAPDPLPSWNDGRAKQSIVDFVREATSKGGARFVAPEDRIVTIDNDGTLWVEQPIYTQMTFAIERVKALAPEHPEWKEQEPFRSILAGNREALEKLGPPDFERVVAATHSGMTTDEFSLLVKSWLAKAEHPRFKKHYTDLVYQPMLELMGFLRSAGFKTYIVTGGGQDFVRTFSARVYGIPVEQVIGTPGKVKYELKDGEPALVKLPDVLFVDDKGGKPEGIHLVIGRRPNAAFGNSNGDEQMLEYAGAGQRAHLMMLVHHDDAAREYAYGPESKVGTFSDALMDEAKGRGWTIISMKNDWKRIFPFER
jgi:phosphoglycolate phosphatase-like HAD superfamily hydrolase